MTYELPVDSYDGRCELQTLARRVARACVHFLQVNTCSFLIAPETLIPDPLFSFRLHFLRRT